MEIIFFNLNISANKSTLKKLKYVTKKRFYCERRTTEYNLFIYFSLKVGNPLFTDRLQYGTFKEKRCDDPEL